MLRAVEAYESVSTKLRTNKLGACFVGTYPPMQSKGRFTMNFRLLQSFCCSSQEFSPPHVVGGRPFFRPTATVL